MRSDVGGKFEGGDEEGKWTEDGKKGGGKGESKFRVRVIGRVK